jgi:hypothetical protein
MPTIWSRVRFSSGASAASSGGQSKRGSPAVGAGRQGLDEAALLERPKGSTEVAAVEVEGKSDLAGGWLLAVRELEEDAGFGERERAAQMLVAEGADAGGVEAVEFADGLGPLIDLAHMPAGKGRDKVNQLVDSVNYFWPGGWRPRRARKRTAAGEDVSALAF